MQKAVLMASCLVEHLAVRKVPKRAELTVALMASRLAQWSVQRWADSLVGRKDGR